MTIKRQYLQASRIGIIGSGFIGKGLVMALEGQPDLTVSRVLTRTRTEERTDFPEQELLINSVDDLIDNSDLIVECSGDVIHATHVIDKVMAASLPVILAGGLSPENAYGAITEVKPAGADSCTQTNRLDGDGRPLRFRKDFVKVAAFVAEVRRAAKAIEGLSRIPVAPDVR